MREARDIETLGSFLLHRQKYLVSRNDQLQKYFGSRSDQF